MEPHTLDAAAAGGGGMSDERVKRIVFSIIDLLVGTVLMFWGIYIGKDSIRADAIKHGVAHYTVNPQTGDSKFEWITPVERGD